MEGKETWSCVTIGTVFERQLLRKAASLKGSFEVQICDEQFYGVDTIGTD